MTLNGGGQMIKKIWSELSSQNSLYDEWDFRYCFYKQHNFPLHFVVGYHESKPIGLLPLQFNTTKNYLEFFGGNYMDENKVFITSGWEEYISDFYGSVNKKACFDNLLGNHEFIRNKKISSYIYFLTVDNIKKYEENDERFFVGSSRHRKQLKKEITNISKNNIKISKNYFPDIELLFDFKIKQFGKESGFSNQNERREFINLLKLNYNFNIITFSINEKKIGISIALLYKEKYMFLEMASDFNEYPNIGKFIIIKNITSAKNLNAKIIDVSKSNGPSWKDRWNFEKIPQYHFKNYKD